MAKTKAKTVKVRVAVVYSDKGEYQGGGYRNAANKHFSDGRLVDDAHEASWTNNRDELPHACLVDIELPIPKPAKPLVGKVLKVKAVKP